jgi:hypothetical protein
MNYMRPFVKLKKIFFWYILIFILSVTTSILISEKVYTKYFIKRVTGAVIRTSYGDIKITFLDSAPRARENFIFLARSGFYNNTVFYRVVPGLLVETGDPVTAVNKDRSFWGWGGPGYTFPDEIQETDQMKKGVVALVNSGENSNGSRFYIGFGRFMA